MANIPTRPVTTRKVTIRALSYAVDGPEQPYPVYQFGEGRTFIERPRHNPFLGLDYGPGNPWGGGGSGGGDTRIHWFGVRLPWILGLHFGGTPGGV